MSTPHEIKSQIIELSKQYSKLVHLPNRPGSDKDKKAWTPADGIPYAARVFDEEEVSAAVSSTLDFWLTLGSEGDSFQRELASFLGVNSCLLVNSGSSANLLALSAITSHKINPKKRLNKGDEVITVAAGFPTTVSPIVQAGAVPVFIDANEITGNACCDQLETAYTPGKTKAVMMAHALGNPFDLKVTLEFCQKYDLWLIEDNCDALGCTYSMNRQDAEKLGFTENSPGLFEGDDRVVRWTGSWGDLSTQSFYPPHHMTTGEGGAVNIRDSKKLKIIVESFRDWGRDCWCPSGKDDSCNKRFGWQLGDLPKGYDHKYTYSHLGYNLKPLDIQAAIGRVQLKKLDHFIQARKDNWQKLRLGLDSYSHLLEFALPTHATKWNADGSFEWDESGCRTTCSWFGFKISLRDNCQFSNVDLARYLDSNKIGNRMLFGGNLVRQPAFIKLLESDSKSLRIASDLTGSDNIMNKTLFLGTYPGLTNQMIDYEIEVISSLLDKSA